MYAYIVYALIEVWKRLLYFYVSTNQLNEQEYICIYIQIYIVYSLKVIEK